MRVSSAPYRHRFDSGRAHDYWVHSIPAWLDRTELSGWLLIVVHVVMSTDVVLTEGLSGAYDKTISMLLFCQTFMFLEIFHSMLGLVKTGVIPSCLQVRDYEREGGRKKF